MPTRERRPAVNGAPPEISRIPATDPGQCTARRAFAVCSACAARYRMDDAVVGSELMRRRYPPTGDRELWVRYGEAGPPEGVAR